MPTLVAWLKFRLLLTANLNWLAPLQVHLYCKVRVMSDSVLLDQKRYDELEVLYVKDGRNKRDHPMYSLYTGLYQAYLAGIAIESANTGEV